MERTQTTLGKEGRRSLQSPYITAHAPLYPLPAWNYSVYAAVSNPRERTILSMHVRGIYIYDRASAKKKQKKSDYLSESKKLYAAECRLLTFLCIQ